MDALLLGGSNSSALSNSFFIWFTPPLVKEKFAQYNMDSEMNSKAFFYAASFFFKMRAPYQSSYRKIPTLP